MYNEGWLMATSITSTVLYFNPSTASNYFGTVEYNHKWEWDYKIRGDCAKRPQAYPDYIGLVEKLQYLEIKSA